MKMGLRDAMIPLHLTFCLCQAAGPAAPPCRLALVPARSSAILAGCLRVRRVAAVVVTVLVIAEVSPCAAATPGAAAAGASLR